MTRCNAMGIALQLLFTGLGVGSIYALVALGFVLIYRATNVVNFAQGDFAMLGAFSMVVLCVDLGLVGTFPIHDVMPSGHIDVAMAQLFRWRSATRPAQGAMDSKYPLIEGHSHIKVELFCRRTIR